MSKRLPIYRLRPDDADVARLIDFGKRIFDFDRPYELSERAASHALRSGPFVVELARKSGGVWAADEAQLWKPSAQPRLPDEASAVAKVSEIMRQQQLLPELTEPFRFGRPTVGGTYFSLVREGKRADRRLDVQVVHPVLVGDLPVVGGGGDFTVILGDGGAVIGFSGVWRPARAAFDADVVGPERADEQFRAMTKSMKVLSFDRSLAYYAAPAFQEQEFLYPVYVYRGTALYGDQLVPLRQIMLPATDFGPPVEFGAAQPPRQKAARTQRARERGLRRSYATLAARNPFEAGTSWIGQSGGLPGSQANAQGFVDELAASGWLINFNWGDGNAWESDWRRNDDAFVDATDFVFYTGHASMNGWVLSNPDDTFLSFNEVGASPGTPGDLWGQNDLEWMVIAACGPLQDEILATGGGNVFDRWDGAFDGLHILLGYGAVTYDNTEEGRRLVQYARQGSTLIDAWFRAAKEIQPSTNGFPAPDGPNVYVGAMWVGRDAIDPANDHAWGFGSVSADPTSPTWYAAMWTLC